MKKWIALLLVGMLAFSAVAFAAPLNDAFTVTSSSSSKYDLDNFGYRYVDSKGRGSLVFQKAPRGKAIKGFKYYTGDRIYVNLYYREDGYAIAYSNGTYGYVDASYINWGSGSSSSSSSGSSGSSAMTSSMKNLNNYEWRKVQSKGRGSLVFQKTPKGKAMSGHRFYDGDWIFVNVNYRKNGYAVAYEDGEYGYVDASYINWDSGSGSGSSGSSSSDSIPSSAKNLDKFDYRKVKTNGRGSLVFQQKPKGKSMSGHKFNDGDWIFVNLNYRKDGYAVAYDNGVYGYVDASYINWNNSSSGGSSSGDGIPSSAKNLDKFGYRRVKTNGRGSLVFQQKPKGKSMPGHKFYDGDRIFVNISYRKDGYAVAYEDGVYGYVDASYIAW
ncbi:MAG: hypothetical protein ACSW8J_07980 [bacterium]